MDKGIVLCANHVNALADPVIVQASIPQIIRPLARSGLFNKPLLGGWLRLMGAVPIFRPGDKGSDVTKNKDSFARCYEMLAKNETMIIFPEGQSHSDSHLHSLKSGAARLTLGALDANHQAPAVIPVGLNFSRKGRFRGDVLVNIGKPIDLDVAKSLSPRQTVREINDRIWLGLSEVTINAESWDDVDIVRRLEQFFAMRQGKVRRANLSQRFNALNRLIDGQGLLREHEPKKVKNVMRKLHAYERLCRRYGVNDYHLTLNYRPGFVLIQIMRMLLAVIIGLPVVVFAELNGAIPYLLTRHLAHCFSKGADQYDTSKILFGTALFSLFWGLQITVVYHWFGFKWMLAYCVALVISAIIAIRIRGQYRHILKDIKVFFMFIHQDKLKLYLIQKRREIEISLAQLVRLAKRLLIDDQKKHAK